MSEHGADSRSTGQACVAEVISQLTGLMARVKHCVGQLDDARVWWRPNESLNSIGNLVLHVCGNLQERILGVVGGFVIERDREKEFAERKVIPKEELLSQLAETVRRAEAILTGLDASQLLQTRRYRRLAGEVETTVLSILLQVLVHLSGHIQEIVLLTRIQLLDHYEFLLKPVGSKGENGCRSIP